MIYRYAILACLFINSLVYAQQGQVGYLNVRNIKPSEYNGTPQTFMAVEDDRGVLYITNNLGVYIYDGSEWELVKLRNESVARSIDIFENRTLFVGGINEFGFFRSGGTDSLEYVSISDTINDFGQVFNTLVAEDKVYYQSRNNIFSFDINTEELIRYTYEQTIKKIVRTPPGIAVVTSKDKVYLLNNEGALSDFEPFSHVDTNLIFKDIIYTSKNRYFGITKKNQLLEINSKLSTTKELLQMELWASDIVRGEGEELLISSDKGVLRVSFDGEVMEQYDKNYGIIENLCHTPLLTNNKELIITTDYGLSVINLSSNLRKIDERYGFEGTVENIRKGKQKVLGVGNKGAFKISEATMSKFNSVRIDAWDIYEYEENHYLLALNDGVYDMYDNDLKRVFDNYPYTIHRSKQDSNYFFIGLDPGLILIHKEANAWVQDSSFEFPFVGRYFDEDEQGNIWIGGKDGVARVNFKGKPAETGINFFPSAEKGLPEASIFPKYSGEKMYFGTYKGLMEFESSNDTFYITQDFGEKIKNFRQTVFRMEFDKDGRLWAYLINNPREKEIGFIDAEGRWNSSQFAEIQDQVLSLNVIDNIAWIGTTKNLFNYHLSKAVKVSGVRNVIRRITQGDSVLYGGYGVDKDGLVSFYGDTSLVLPHNKQALQIAFSRPQYGSKEGVEYSFYMEGLSRDWSSWSSKNYADFTNLPAGKYTFRVKSRLNNTALSEETIIKFRILPPWYQTWWAITVYIIILGLLVYLIIIWRTRALKKRQKELEHEVALRTQEVVEQKTEAEKQRDIAEQQKHIIQEKNQEITASINYASRIQQAVLTSEEYLKNMFEHHFIYYVPRDIVSGDFYWAYQTSDNKKIWAAADCTGHGVPGGFMSMLGMGSLNEIVMENNITSPDLILNELRRKIIQAFDKTSGDAERKDGMDIGLCVYDTNTNVIEFSGAYNPMYLVREFQKIPSDIVENKEYRVLEAEENSSGLIEFKASKMPVGKHILDKEPFAKVSFKLLPGDRLYTFSDGFPDQFGGEKKKKYMSKKFKKFILSIQHHDMKSQEDLLKDEFESWLKIGETEQIDDVCIVGVQI